MSLANLDGRRVLVTGAASGIGRATAMEFAKEGAKLILTDVNRKGLERVRDEAWRAGAKCAAIPCDMSHRQDIERFASEVLEREGGIDVLINNAGVAYIGSFVDTPAAQWQRIHDINVMGMVNLTQALLPSMLADRRAKSIVNIASAAGFAPAAYMSAYAASKHAVVGLSEVLAMELDGTNVTVTIVAPGIINTPISNSPRGQTVSSEQVEKLQQFYRKKGSTSERVGRDIVGAVKSGTMLLKTGKYAALMCGLMRLSRPLARRSSIMNSRKIGFLN